jgi:N-acetylated-alpha-linked acidic dipeptidase
MGVPVTIEDNRYANAPIPSYDEAISQPSRSGPSEISDDAERQGLLGQSSQSQADTRTRAGGYRAPTVESARSSIDSDLTVPEMVEDGEDARRQVV